MYKMILVAVICLTAFACNSNDTAHAGVQDSTKITVDTPKAVIVDSSKIPMAADSTKKDSAH